MRCSKLPLFFECPSSATKWEHPINISGEAAQLGTAVHAALASMVMGEDPNLVEHARGFAVPLSDLERLYAYGKKVWAILAPHIGTPAVEQSFDGVGLLGACDVMSTTGPLVVIDWKSGQVYRDHKTQMMGYASLAHELRPVEYPVKAIIAWLQLGFYEVYDFTESDFSAFGEDLEKNTNQIGKRYAPSAHCGFCEGQAECAAKAAYERMACNALSVPVSGELTTERLAALYPQAKLLEKAIEAYGEMLKAALLNGPIEIPDGRQIELKEITKQVIQPFEAWPILEKVLTQEELAKCVTIGKGKLLEAIGDKSADRMKKKDQDALIRRLKEAGAISESSFMKVQVSKSQKKIDS